MIIRKTSDICNFENNLIIWTTNYVNIKKFSLSKYFSEEVKNSYSFARSGTVQTPNSYKVSCLQIPITDVASR